MNQRASLRERPWQGAEMWKTPFLYIFLWWGVTDRSYRAKAVAVMNLWSNHICLQTRCMEWPTSIGKFNKCLCAISRTLIQNSGFQLPVPQILCYLISESIRRHPVHYEVVPKCLILDALEHKLLFNPVGTCTTNDLWLRSMNVESGNDGRCLISSVHQW